MQEAIKGAYNDGEMTFDEIAKAMGISRQIAERLYHRALRKIQADGPAIEALIDWKDFHDQLRARSLECLRAQEHF